MNKDAETPAATDTKAKGRKTLAERTAAAKAKEEKAAETLRRRRVKVQKYEAQQRSLARRLDTRKKVIAGALALEHMQFDGRYGQAFRALIDEYVTRDEDRALFDLERLPDDDQRRVSPPKIY